MRGLETVSLGGENGLLSKTVVIAQPLLVTTNVEVFWCMGGHSVN